MGKWLAKYKNLPEMPIRRTDNTDAGQVKRELAEVIDFASEAAKVKAALSNQGIAAIKSGTLGEVVYWAKDETEAAKAPLGAVVYTIGELKHLYSGGNSREGLKQIHAAKKIFGGKIVESNENPFANT